MKKEVILVEKGECPLEVIVDLGEKAKNAWIFFHDNAILELEKRADYVSGDRKAEKMTWRKTKKYPKTILWTEPNVGSYWIKVTEIIADDIAFRKVPFDPENIFFIKMKE